MSTISDAQDALEAAAGAVEGMRVYKLGEQVTPPGVVVGPPRLTARGGCTGPTDAVFPVYVVVALDDRATERLWDLVPLVWAAIEGGTVAVVQNADPGTYNGGAGDLPMYELSTEYPI